MNKRFILLPIAALILLMTGTGCEYESYKIIVADYQVEGIAISDWRSVESDGSSIKIHPGGRFAIKMEEQTQYLTQLDVVIRSGSGANFYMRTVPHEFSTDSGERFRYSVNGSDFRRADGTVVPLEYNAEPEEKTIKLLIEADLVEVSAGCERLYQGRTDLEATEYIIIEAMDDAEIEILGVNVYDIDEV